jgi:hypothetical protein
LHWNVDIIVVMTRKLWLTGRSIRFSVILPSGTIDIFVPYPIERDETVNRSGASPSIAITSVHFSQ